MHKNTHGKGKKTEKHQKSGETTQTNVDWGDMSNKDSSEKDEHMEFEAVDVIYWGLKEE